MYIGDHIKEKMQSINNFDELSKFIKTHIKLLNRYEHAIQDKIVDLLPEEKNVLCIDLLSRLVYTKNGDITEAQFNIASIYANGLLLDTCPDYNYFDIFILLLNRKQLEKIEINLKEKDLDGYKHKLILLLNKIYDLYIPTIDSYKHILKMVEKYDYSLVAILEDEEFYMVKEYFNEYRIDLKYQLIKDYWYYSNITNKFIEDIYTIADRYKKYYSFGDMMHIIYTILLDVKTEKDVNKCIIEIISELTYNGNYNKPVFELILLDIAPLINDIGDVIQYSHYKEIITQADFFGPINTIEPTTEAISEIEFDYSTNILEYAMEAQKKASVNLHDAQAKIYKAFKNYKNAEAKVDSQITGMTNSLKGLLIGDVRTEVVEGKQMTAIGALKAALRTSAIFAFGPIKGLILLLVRYALKKNTTVSERKKIILELEAELELIDEKIEDARGDGNRKAKYAMMRTRTEIINALRKIKLGLEADQRSIDTAKKLINK